MSWWESGFSFGRESLPGFAQRERPVRVTDEVVARSEQGDLPGAVEVVRRRRPDARRWRMAVGVVARRSIEVAHGFERHCAEEALREIVINVGDRALRRETVLDVRLQGLDIDRGDVLPRWRIGELRRLAYLLDLELDAVAAHVPLPDGFSQGIDTPGVVLTGRHLAGLHRHNAERQLRRLPDAVKTARMSSHQAKILSTAQWASERARRWNTLAEHLAYAR